MAISIWDIEDQSMLCCDFDKLRKELPVQTWTPLGSRIDDLRQIKTEEELEYLARAEEIGDKDICRIFENRETRNDRAGSCGRAGISG